MKNYGNYYEIDGNSAAILNWVASAKETSFSGWRLGYTRLHVEEGNAMCTDGRRLHIGKLPRVSENVINYVDGKRVREVIEKGPILPDGDYQIVGSKPKLVQLALVTEIEEKDKFPSWKRLTPKDDPTFTGLYKAFSLKQPDKLTEQYARFIRNCPADNPVNISYLSDLSFCATWKYEIRPTKLVAFTSGVFTAWIMPMEIGY